MTTLRWKLLGLLALLLSPFALMIVGAILTWDDPWWWQLSGALVVLTYSQVVNDHVDRVIKRMEEKHQKEE